MAFFFFFCFFDERGVGRFILDIINLQLIHRDYVYTLGCNFQSYPDSYYPSRFLDHLKLQFLNCGPMTQKRARNVISMGTGDAAGCRENVYHPISDRTTNFMKMHIK